MVLDGIPRPVASGTGWDTTARIASGTGWDTMAYSITVPAGFAGDTYVRTIWNTSFPRAYWYKTYCASRIIGAFLFLVRTGPGGGFACFC